MTTVPNNFKTKKPINKLCLFCDTFGQCRKSLKQPHSVWADFGELNPGSELSKELSDHVLDVHEAGNRFNYSDAFHL